MAVGLETAGIDAARRAAALVPRAIAGARLRLQLGTVVLMLGIAAVILMTPRLGSYSVFVVALVGTKVMAALSLNVLMGYAGQVSLGQAAFVGVGAYTAAELTGRAPFPVPLLAAVLVGALIATIVGLPSLRIRGLQVAATTLAFGVAAGGLIFARPWVSSSSAGVAVPRPSILHGDRSYAVVVWLVLLAMVVVDALMRRGRLGRAFLAVRDREENAAAWGIPVGRTKLAAYAVSGAYAGTAGALFAYLLERVTPNPFDVWASFALVAAVVIGGLGSAAGVVIAESVLIASPELLRPLQTWSPLIGAVLLLAVPLLRPEGLGWFLNRPVLGRRRSSAPSHVKDTVADESAALEEDDVLDGLGRVQVHSVGADLAAKPVRPIALSVPVRTVLTIEDLRITFGGLQALRGVHLEVRRHEAIGLIGPNGAGKSTVFNCISGLARPDTGRIRYRDQDLLALPAHQRQGLGLARTFQQVGLCLPQTVGENLLIAQHPYASKGRSVLATRGRQALELLNLGHLVDERVADLPHGQQRLVEIAAALATGPELLLLDEPAAGLSPEEAAELVEHLQVLREELGLTLLVIEHHIPVITNLCSYVYVLAEGQVLAEGRPADIQRNEAVVKAYLGGDHD